MNKLKNVVDGDFCTGCGACAYATNSSMTINSYGEYIPILSDVGNSSAEIAEKVCPSLHPELNETVLGKDLFKGYSNFSDKIGAYEQCFAGFVKEDTFRTNGTSGGFGTWVAAELLRLGKIDGVIHVKEAKRDGIESPFYKYQISETLTELKSGSKTKYHVVELSEVLNELRNKSGKYLFVGVPCLVKSLRRIQLVDKDVKDKIPYTIALVCGHFKSINWSLSLAWGKNISPNNVSNIQYRTKGESIPARAYVFKAFNKNGSVIQENAGNVVGGKFNAGALMVPACDFCDDVVGETADITIGDAWIPKYEVDDRGTNLLIVRNPELVKIINAAHSEERVHVTEISGEEAISSQSGGFRQRRDGLSYRLKKKKDAGLWFPEKRVEPGQFKLTKERERIYDSRSEVTSLSREKFKEALVAKDYSIYSVAMERKIKQLRFMEIKNSFFRLLFNKISRVFLSTVKKVK